MSFTYIDSVEGLAELARTLETEPRIALDCEAAGYHRYSDRLCLIQLSTPETTFLIDPLAVDPAEVLRTPLEDRDVQVLMHGADFDIRLLRRDLSIRVSRIFDTQIAASLLGEPALGLQALVEKHVEIHLTKKFQKADWAQRPLAEEMLEYAAGDTRHLHMLAEKMANLLHEAGRMDWAEEEFRIFETITESSEEEVDPVTRVKGARYLAPRTITALREALRWRDKIAVERDVALFRVCADGLLVELAENPPETVEALGEMKGMNPRTAARHGAELLAALASVRRLPDEELLPYPMREMRGPGRPLPEVEERVNRMKSVRNQKAEALGVARGVLLSNTTIQEIAEKAPQSRQDLEQIFRMKRWQREVMGEELLRALGASH